jgi:hypothetical protein
MKWMSSLLAVFAVSLPLVARAADAETQAYPAAGDESKNYQTEVVVKGLDNPSGLAIRPTTGNDSTSEIYFSESGAGRVMRFTVSNPAETKEVVADFETQPLNETIDLRVGPWALGFVTPTKLAVLGGMHKEGTEQVGVFVLSDDDKVLKAEELDHTAELTDGYGQKSNAGFPGMVLSDTAAYMSVGSGNAGTIFKAMLAANRIDSPRPLVSSNAAELLSWPSGLCLSPAVRTQFLVAAYLGALSEKRDSRVVFIIPSGGDVAMRLTPGLFDIVALAYSPSGQLYAVDFSWQEENEGGVYRLDDARLDGQPACRAVKIASVVHPTSLKFDESGNLYVTSFGTGTNAKHGKITKITGSF